MNEKTLTAEQCSKLSLYILMTTKTREGEAATWEKLAPYIGLGWESTQQSESSLGWHASLGPYL